MKMNAIRRAVLWLCPALAVLAVVVATSHMDYAVNPRDRNGEVWIAEHGGMVFNIAIVVDRSAPCVPAGRFLLAGLPSRIQ